MRSFLLLFFLPLFANLSTAQEYVPLLQEGKTWDIYAWSSGGITYYDYGYRCYIAGDSVVNGTTYKHIRQRYFQDPDGPPFWPPFTVGANSSFYALMREDTAAQQVFAYFTHDFPPDSAEVMVYDFSLQPGDTMFIPEQPEPPDGNGCCFYEAVLDSISPFTLLNGQVVRQFHFTFTNGPGGVYPRVYTEGIGNGPLLIPFTYDFEFGAILGCVKMNGAPIWDYGACNDVVATREMAYGVSDFKITPNPVYTRSFTVEMNLEKTSEALIQVFSSQGRAVDAPQAISGESGQVTLPPDLPSGSYFLRIQTENGIGMKKLLVF
jgi:hypothetical protein